MVLSPTRVYALARALFLSFASVLTPQVQVGLISFLLGFFRLGFIDVVLSRALLRGFVTAVAVVIMMCVSPTY